MVACRKRRSKDEGEARDAQSNRRADSMELDEDSGNYCTIPDAEADVNANEYCTAGPIEPDDNKEYSALGQTPENSPYYLSLQND